MPEPGHANASLNVVCYGATLEPGPDAGLIPRMLECEYRFIVAEYEVLDVMAQTTHDSGSRTSLRVQEQVLRAHLAVEPHPDSSCAVVDDGREVSDLTHHLKFVPGACSGACTPTECGECHTEVAYADEDGDERTYVTTPVSSHCICPVFASHDCIPHIDGVESGAIMVTLTVPSREVLKDIIADLRRVGATVNVEWLVNGRNGSRTAEIDVSSITDKQREALELAMESGFYEKPRETDLGAIANELGISESAASQRLNAAETKLVRSFLAD